MPQVSPAEMFRPASSSVLLQRQFMERGRGPSPWSGTTQPGWERLCPKPFVCFPACPPFHGSWPQGQRISPDETMRPCGVSKQVQQCLIFLWVQRGLETCFNLLPLVMGSHSVLGLQANFEFFQDLIKKSVADRVQVACI